MATADEYKELGNDSYKKGDWSKAIGFYGKAIERDPHNGILFNNRAAAYLQVAEWRSAANDADQSLLLSPTAKAHSRHGAAQKGLGNYGVAKRSYEAAQRMNPDPSYKAALAELETLIKGSGNGSSRAEPAAAAGGANPADPSGTRALYLNAGVVLFAVLHLLTLFLAPLWISTLIWRLCLASMAGRQFVALMRGADGVRPALSMTYAKHFAATGKKTFTGLYLMLTCILTGVNGPPLHLLMVAMVVYVTVDLVSNYLPVLQASIARVPMAGMLGGRLEQVVAQVKENRNNLLANAALSEIMAVVMAPLAGMSLVLVLGYCFFLKFRYQSDSFSKLAFAQLHKQAGMLFHHQRAPLLLGKGFVKFAALLHSWGSS
jgi:hypothetical protein